MYNCVEKTPQKYKYELYNVCNSLTSQYKLSQIGWYAVKINQICIQIIFTKVTFILTESFIVLFLCQTKAHEILINISLDFAWIITALEATLKIGHQFSPKFHNLCIIFI